MSAAAEATVVEVHGYQIVIRPGVIEEVGQLVAATAPAHRYALITDSNVGPLYAQRVAAALAPAHTEIFTIPAGETHKSRETWARVTDAMLDARYARDSTAIALGGGVVGDLAGFVAATYMRGIPFVQVPTSLLAMIDASIGGKTGVDTAAGKNLVGAFHQPRLVLVDPNLLATLPEEQLISGAAEAIKHGVIADESYFEFIGDHALAIRDRHRHAEFMTRLIATSVAIKARIVRDDEREGGLRKTLNFGHTLGHAIESCSNYRLLHGEAIAIGMVLESTIAERMSVASNGTAARIRQVVERAGLPAGIPAGMAAEAIIAATMSDKKARGGIVEYALPSGIGSMAGASSDWGVKVPPELVAEAVNAAI